MRYVVNSSQDVLGCNNWEYDSLLSAVQWASWLIEVFNYQITISETILR